ncbi:MAG: choice-of-anchor D domain-containing protein [Gammaproteobacteria bacterium]|nr:choice-of-anchor D domain-containing protein [Gammaproteobacteria bacterium]
MSQLTVRSLSLLLPVAYLAASFLVHPGVALAQSRVEIPTPHKTPGSEAEMHQALDNLRALNLPELEYALAGVEARLETGALTGNDRNLLCIGAFTIPFATAFGIGLVPNPPWDYLLGQLPAYAANLGLKFCPAVLEAPGDFEVEPNVDTADGPNCAYDFSQPIIAGGREDFMGVPYRFLGDWTFTRTPDSRGFGTPGVFHYNTGVDVRMVLPGEAPPGYLEETPDPEFVAEIGPFGIRAPQNDIFNAIGCALDGSVPLNNDGGPCPIDFNRTLQLPVGRHTITWRAETSVGLLDTLPPIYVPGKPPGSKKEAAKEILKGIYEAVRDMAAGSFLESYPTGVVTLANQSVNVLDTTAPVMQFADPALATFRVEAQEPGGQSTRAFLNTLRDSIVATDACNRTPQVNAPLPSFLPLGSHPLTWTARDAGPAPGGGFNTSTLMQTIIVEDTQPPQIAPPPSVVVESNTAPVFVATGSPQVFDVADLEPTIEFDGPLTFPFGVTSVFWRAIDASGNVSPWVEQTINVKLSGSNNTPVAADAETDAVSFEEVDIPLSASDMDGDELYFYIDRQPDEGFFVAPLLPTFVDDLRVQAQFDPGPLCLGGGTLPPQDYVWDPRYVTTNDDGITYVIDRIVKCTSSGSGINTSNSRIARFGPDGELLAEFDLGSGSAADQVERLSFHPGGLPGYPDPFMYWVSPATDRLITLDAELNGSIEVIVIDFLPSGTPAQGDPVDAVIDLQGVAYVTDTRRIYAFDFLERDSSNALAFLDRIGAPLSSGTGSYGRAWDMDIDSMDALYISDWGNSRIYKFGASTIDRSVSPAVFTTGEFIGWLGRCDSDNAPGDAAVCDLARQRSIGYSCTDSTCGATQTAGDLPSQFSRPQGFAIDPNDILYVADRGNNRIQRFTPEGFFAGQAISDCDAVNCFVIGEFGVAEDVTVNSTSFFVLDSNTDILHIFTADPVTMTGPDTGFVTYRSNNNFIGLDSFDWFASDGLRVDGELVRSNIASATVDVAQNQRLPFATVGITAQVIEDQATGILLDGSDPDIGDTYPWEPLQSLSAVLITPPARGQVSISGLTATYTPSPDYNGSDAFEFAVTDGIAISAPETVTIEVLPVNDPPELTPASDPADLIAGIGYPWELNIGVFDPDPGDAHNMLVAWGDGTAEAEGEILNDGTITGPLLDFNAGGEGMVHARHVYSSGGQRSVQTCVTDSAPVQTCSTISIDVVPMTDLAVFERDAPRAIPIGQPISYQIGLSNFQGEGGAGIPATGVTLEVDLDPRLSVLGISGASCVEDGNRRVCTIPDLLSIPRGESDGTPPIDRQVTINAIADPGLPLGTRLASRARMFADPINRNTNVSATFERVLVADGDLTVDPLQDDSADANPGDGFCEDEGERCTLRAAIEEANALGGSRIVALPDGLFRLDQGSVPVTGDLTLIGLGVGLSEIVADGAQRLFDVAPGGRLVLIGVTLSGDEYVGGVGGLIRNDGELIIEDALLQNGDASNGGAIYSTGSLVVRRSTFTQNVASLGGASGGAISNSGSAVIENSLLFANNASSGGAISSNAAAGASLSLLHVTITGNTARSIGAALFDDFSGQPMATLENTILSGNTAVNPGGGGCLNQLVSAGGNVINDDREGCPFTPEAGDLVDIDPRLEPAVVLDNGRIVLEPRADSPAVDALTAPCIATDLRNLDRPQGGSACDIGAFERGIAAAATVSPSVIDFGPVMPGQVSAPQLLTISSTGNLPLNVLSIEQPDAPFMVAGGDCPLPPFELAPASACTLALRFMPVDAAPEIRDLAVAAQLENTLGAVELWGNVTRPVADFDPGAIDFGELPIGQPPIDRIVTLGNSGDFDLEVDALSLSGAAAADFELDVSQDGCSGVAVEPGDACGFIVRFAPSATGVSQAELRLDSNEPEGARFIELRGTRDVVFFSGFED